MASAHAQRVAAMTANQILSDARNQNYDLFQQGYADARNDVTGNFDKSLSALGSGFDAARGSYGDAIQLYEPYRTTGLAALGNYADATGVNGQGGYDKATASFRASPGYQYTVDQASDQVARKASALGVLGSGNTMAAITDRAGHLADQEYGSYLDRLSGLSTLGYNATGAQAGLTKGLGDLSATQGTQTAGLYTGLGTSLAGLDMGRASGIAGSNVSLTAPMANNEMQAGAASDAAKTANENLLLGLGGLGVNMLTGGFGRSGTSGTSGGGTGLLSLFR
jgi:hypothetical protein